MASDLKKYAQDLFKKAGLEEKGKAILEALGDEEIAKVLRDGFVETSQHHSTLDRVKSEWESKAKTAEDRVRQYDEWYEKQAKPAFESRQRDLAALQAYQQTYGPIETGSEVRQAAAAVGLTKEEVAKLLQEELGKKDQAYVSLTKDVAYITNDYSNRFKEPIDLDALEQHALKSGLPLRQAYKDFINPKVEEQRNQEIEAKLKAAREEGFKDAMSKHHLPVDSGPRESHPIFDRKEPVTPMNDAQQERASREAFLAGWNEAAESTTH